VRPTTRRTAGGDLQMTEHLAERRAGRDVGAPQRLGAPCTLSQTWKAEYNTQRPPSAVQWRTPTAVARTLATARHLFFSLDTFRGQGQMA